MTKDQLNTLSGGITQFQAILDAMKVALDIATNGYITDQAKIDDIQKQLDDANALIVQLQVQLAGQATPPEQIT